MTRFEATVIFSLEFFSTVELFPLVKTLKFIKYSINLKYILLINTLQIAIIYIYIDTYTSVARPASKATIIGSKKSDI